MVKISLRPKCATVAEIDAERDRRADRGFEYHGMYFQARDKDKINITGASVAAGNAIALYGEALRGNLRWSNPDKDFEWIGSNNDKMPMDPYTVVEFAMVAMYFTSDLINSARDLKNTVITGGYVSDITDDSHWGPYEFE